MGKTRLLACGHARSATGFARVLHSLLHHLPPHYEIHHLGSNVHGDLAGSPVGRLDPVAEPAPSGPAGPAAGGRTSTSTAWRIYANPQSEQAQAHDELRRLVWKLRPHLLLILDEPWAAAAYRPLLQSLPRGCRSVLYAAIDGADSCTAEHLEQICDVHSLVLFNRFGRQVVERAARALPRGTRLPALQILPHGIDHDVFHELLPDDGSGNFTAARAAARRQLFGDDSAAGDADTFIVLNANRNQPNKRIDLTVEGFALFARGKPPGVKLYLHMGTARPTPGRQPLIDRLNLRQRLLTSSQGTQHPRLSSRQLNLVYNACNVGINTSEGEGWGLIAFEHGATGAAQIVTDHSACRELWQGSGLLLPTAEADRVEGYQRLGRTVTAAGVAEALQRLYEDRALHRRASLAAWHNARRPELAWRAIARRWHEHFQQLISVRH